MRLMSSLRTNKEIKERKKILENIRLMLDQYNTFMVEYMCKRERDTFLQKRISKGEKRNEGYIRNSEWKEDKSKDLC